MHAHRRVGFSLLSSLVVVAACTPRHEAAAPTPTPAAPTVAKVDTPAPAAPPTPLPEGWAWPFHPSTPAGTAFTPFGIERPFDLAKVTALHQNAPKLSPFQAAPGVWVTPIDKAFRFTPPKGGSSSLKGSSKTPAPNPATLPVSADLRAIGLDGPIMNQQLVGVCWTFAVSNTMSNALRRSGRNDVIAPLHVLASTTWDDLWDGKAGPALVTEPQWTYDPVKACKLDDRPDSCSQAYHVQAQSWQSDPELVSERSLADTNGALQATHATTFEPSDHVADRIAGAVAAGESVYVGMDIDLDLWSNQVKGGHIPDWSNGDSGHAVTIVGYRPSTAGRDFLVHNSWGTTWGDQGYAWMSETMLTKYVKEAFVIDAVQATKGTPVPAPKTPTNTGTWPFPPIPVPTPTPTPVPTGNGCGTGQVRDLVFGMCVAPCGDGNPPAAGLCAPTNVKTPTIGSPGGSKCPKGQVIDWVTGVCSAQCKSGLPPVAGMCAP